MYTQTHTNMHAHRQRKQTYSHARCPQKDIPKLLRHIALIHSHKQSSYPFNKSYFKLPFQMH